MHTQGFLTSPSAEHHHGVETLVRSVDVRNDWELVSFLSLPFDVSRSDESPGRTPHKVKGDERSWEMGDDAELPQHGADTFLMSFEASDD